MTTKSKKLIITAAIFTLLFTSSFLNITKNSENNGSNQLPSTCYSINNNSHKIRSIALDDKVMADKWSTTKSIFDRLLAHTDLNVKVVLIRHKISRFVAYSDYNRRMGWAEVHLSDGTLNLLMQNENFVALVIAHELNHIINGDVGTNIGRAIYCSSSNSASRQCEKDADLDGKILAGNAGFDPCVGPQLFEIFEDVFGPDPHKDSTHPSNAERAAYMKCFEYLFKSKSCSRT